ncbi:MAG: DUF4292 domain-containing protein [Chloroflexi bacterium]|nr:DUF4292 domain-containing protein [Chloroflexota bacterium]
MKGWLGKKARFFRDPLCAGLAAGILLAGLAGCAVRQRAKLPPALLAPLLQKATLAELLAQVQQQQTAIRTLSATVELQPSATSLSKGEIVEYRDVRAFLLIRRPAFLRMIGQAPVVRSTAFDMASNGETFALYIPSKNRFIIGKNQVGKRAESALENMRPQHLLDALLWEPPKEGKEEAVLEASQEGGKAYYIVHILRRSRGEHLQLARNFWFERQGLTLERLQIFDDSGEALTEVRYSNYASFPGISYPQQIVLDRPQDHYGMTLTVSKIEFNQPLGEDKFRLEQPAGTERMDLEKTPPAEKGGGGG